MAQLLHRNLVIIYLKCSYLYNDSFTYVSTPMIPLYILATATFGFTIMRKEG